MAVPDLKRPARPAEPHDTQALLHTGFRDLHAACFLLLRIEDAATARASLRALAVTNATPKADNTEPALQIAFSMPGLCALGVPDHGFPYEFRYGMTREGASRRLGDVGDNAPDHWEWGGASKPDILLMLYAQTEPPEWRNFIPDTPFMAGLRIIRKLATQDMDNREPFGFRDGISQPSLDWRGQRNPSLAQELVATNLIAPGEFVLGYRNEYGLYTDRPLLAENAAGASILPSAEDRPGMRDLGRNGSYLVLRELHQDVGAFWDFMRRQGESDPAAIALAEAMMGRRRDGTAMTAGDTPIDNDFTYDAYPDGMTCPIGAHVRRAHPRTADMPGGPRCLFSRLIRVLGFHRPPLREDLIAASRFHRILRRGRPFGAAPAALPAIPNTPAEPTGLYFMCLNANIPRQFEFVQGAWLHNAKFAGLASEGDPITGNRAPFPAGEATDGFGMPQPNGTQRRIAGLPRFVTVKGGAYFFLPGIRALKFILRQPE